MKARLFHFSRGFTLVELLLSTALIALLMLLFITMIENTGKIWSRTTAKVSQFQATRAAFDAMTRSLSQATLNTYWQVDPPKPTTVSEIANWKPTDYVRASDLHFVCGQASKTELLGTPEKENPTHAVFFQAPLGATSTPDPADSKLLKFDRLDNMLGAVGYYVAWGKDDSRPAFLDSLSPKLPDRYRFRLMQARQEGEAMAIYGMNAANQAKPKAPPFSPTDWVKAATGKTIKSWVAVTSSGTSTKPEALLPRSMAENIVGLVVLPRRSEKPIGGSASDRTLAPEYAYDSRPSSGGSALPWSSVKAKTPEKMQFNQLPPVVQVSMIAIDEQSAVRVSNGPTAPDWTVGLFKKSDKMEDDFNTLETTLQAARVNYRIFSTDVIIRGSKWTRPD